MKLKIKENSYNSSKVPTTRGKLESYDDDYDDDYFLDENECEEIEANFEEIEASENYEEVLQALEECPDAILQTELRKIYDECLKKNSELDLCIDRMRIQADEYLMTYADQSDIFENKERHKLESYEDDDETMTEAEYAECIDTREQIEVAEDYDDILYAIQTCSDAILETTLHDTYIRCLRNNDDIDTCIHLLTYHVDEYISDYSELYESTDTNYGNNSKALSKKKELTLKGLKDLVNRRVATEANDMSLNELPTDYTVINKIKGQNGIIGLLIIDNKDDTLYAFTKRTSEMLSLI